MPAGSIVGERFTDASLALQWAAIALLSVSFVLIWWKRGFDDVLYLWIGLVLIASIADLTLSAVAGARFTIGWHAARASFVVSACLLLAFLLGDLANAGRRLSRTSLAAAYGGAVAVTLAASFLRWFLDPWLGVSIPFVTLYGAVAIAVWFGIKIHVYQDDLASIAMAMVLARPVKFVATRRESFVSDIHAREQTIDVEVAAGEDGVVSAMRARISAAVGPYSAFPRSSVVEGGQVLRLLPGPYRLRHYDGTLRVVAQNKVITSQYRAVGHPIATAVTESMLDLIARELGVDPAEIRRRNLVRPDELPYTSATGNVYDSGSYHAALDRLLEAAKYDDLRREQATARAQGRYVGIGMSCFVELTGPGAQFYGVGGAPISGQEGATLRLEPSGAVTALVGVTDQGQGTPTAYAQIIADELGVAPDAVAVRSGDTALMPYGGGTWASRGMPIGGSATLQASRALADKIRRAAATVLEAASADIELAGGRASVRGAPDRGLTLGELARTVHFRSNELKGLEPSLDATVHFTNAQPWTFTNGAHLAVVDVDLETGRVRVLCYVAVDDCGRIVNPALVEGQIAGGIAQGLGGALMEHCAYDDAGQPLAGTLMDYAVPTAADVPALELYHLETPAPSIAGGYKGAGEAGCTGAPAAILNAVNDALAPLGVMITDQPITPERVRRAVHSSPEVPRWL
jgi:carbon-monoxide dehydrogenase large subunit